MIYKKPHQALHNRASTTLICRLRLKDDLPAMIKGDAEAAKRFLTRAIRRHCRPEKITIDGSAANEAVIKSYNADHGTSIEIRKVKYLNNLAL